MTSVQKVVTLVLIVIFFSLACYGVYEEMEFDGWNGFSYALYVTPSLTVLVGLWILYRGIFKSLGDYLRAVWVPVVLTELILFVLGGVRYKNLLDDEPIKWLQFLIQPDLFTLLGMVLLLLMCLYGLVYLVGRILPKRKGTRNGTL